MNDITLKEFHNVEHYENMIQYIENKMPNILSSTESFHKSSSQLKTVTLDINDLTEIGSAKHILASIYNTRQALKESEISVRRKSIQIKRKEFELQSAKDFDKEEIIIDITELKSHLEDITAAQRGAVRKMVHLIQQYESICQRLGVDLITEKMYEDDEAKYHTMRAFSQALAAARSRGGIIDEGNFIYFQDLGINGAAAQREVTAYFEAEQEIIDQGMVPTFEMQFEWLKSIADKFSKEVLRYAKYRGFRPIVPEAFAQQ